MANPIPAPAPPLNITPWNEDTIFAMLGDPVRRRLLKAVACNEALPASGLMSASHRRLAATVKQLTNLRDAGLLVTTPDPVDHRRMLYSLAPTLPVTRTESEVVCDFGFCRLQW
jgi:hypothetical protein